MEPVAYRPVSRIVVDAEETNRMYVGLRPGINEHRLQEAVVTGDFGDCLHSYQAQVGDCLHLEPGTVHALGGGLLIAEIQQPSDVTYRLYDWDRVDSEGKPRQLHIEQGMAATNFERGAVVDLARRLFVGCARFRAVFDDEVDHRRDHQQREHGAGPIQEVVDPIDAACGHRGIGRHPKCVGLRELRQILGLLSNGRQN